MPMHSSDPASASTLRPPWYWNSVFHLASLAALTAYFLAVSWRRWPDLITDFGRELYTPWRLSQGAVLYRDLDAFYGPLSQYFNAALFKLFGPGLMVLATANIVFFLGIVVALYGLFRAAWDGLAAWVAAAMFIAIFGMSRLIDFGGNFTYIAPYAHETTHGMLVLLALVAVLWRWSESPRVTLTISAGFLFGLALVLKPEIVFSGAALTICAVMLVPRSHVKSGGRLLVLWFGSAIVPTALFSLYFVRYFSLADAVAAASRAWLNVVATSSHVADPIQLLYTGLDAPATHLAEHLAATVLAVGLFSLIAGLGWLADRASDRRLPFAALAFALPVILVCSWSRTGDGWMKVGRCLLGLQLLYLAAQCAAMLRRRSGPGQFEDRRHRLRLLLAILATTLLSRMALNGRLSHYGYYQAAIAAVMLPAIVLSEVPEWLRVGLTGRIVIATCTLALIVPGVVLIARLSGRVYGAVNYSIGDGRDQFFVLTPAYYRLGPTVDGIVRGLRKTPPGETLLVLPEGVMLNYLARMPSPLAHFSYFSVVTDHGKEKSVVAELARNPPTWVVGVAHSLREYGIAHYGERSGAGADILTWVDANYDQTGRNKDRPLDLARDGAIIYRKKAAR